MPDQQHTPAEPRLTARLRAVLEQVPALVAVLRGPDHVVAFANGRRDIIPSAAPVLGRPLREILGSLADQPEAERFAKQLRAVLASGTAVHGWEAPVRLPASDRPTYWDYVIIPLADPGEPPDSVVVHAVEVTRLVEQRKRAEEAEHRFTTLFESNVIGVTITDADRVHVANEAFLETIGRTREELEGGLSWTELTPPESREVDERALEQLRSAGAAQPYEKEYLRPDGSRVRVLISASRLQSEPLRILNTSYDLSEREVVEVEIASLLERERDARFAAELAGARTSRLQEITAGLSATNSREEIARSVVHHGLEALSASAAMLVRGEKEPEVARAVGFRPDDLEQWRQYPGLLPQALTDAIATGSPVVLADPAAVASGCPELSSDSGAIVAVPLRGYGRTLGGLLLAFRDARELTPSDREFLVALAFQAGAALERADLFEDRAFVARKLQEGLLPRRLADIPGAESAVVYESISGGGEVGGDFYDLFETGRGGWVLSIGDVSGKGTAAAVVTGIARHTVRAVARLFDEPDAILEFLNGALLRHDGPPAFCTVAAATIESAAGGGFDVRVSSGGHPFPIVLRASGELEEVELIGTMLGVAADPALGRAGITLAPGDALVLYTDGVIDARATGGERFGEERLLAKLRGLTGRPAAEIAGAVDAAVRDHHPGVPADDRAIVVLRAL